MLIFLILSANRAMAGQIVAGCYAFSILTEVIAGEPATALS